MILIALMRARILPRPDYFKRVLNTRLSRLPFYGGFQSVANKYPYEEYTGECHELGSYFQEKIPKRVCQFFAKIPERAITSVRNSR